MSKPRYVRSGRRIYAHRRVVVIDEELLTWVTLSTSRRVGDKATPKGSIILHQVLSNVTYRKTDDYPESKVKEDGSA